MKKYVKLVGGKMNKSICVGISLAMKISVCTCRIRTLWYLQQYRGFDVPKFFFNKSKLETKLNHKAVEVWEFDM
jgi:hypothetical protein